MVLLVVIFVLLLLGAAAAWVWVCRDTGTHDQPPFGEPRFTDHHERRAER